MNQLTNLPSTDISAQHEQDAKDLAKIKAEKNKEAELQMKEKIKQDKLKLKADQAQLKKDESKLQKDSDAKEVKPEKVAEKEKADKK